MDAYLAIVSKREVRNYADRPIEPDARRRILEAGRVSGSSANKQQWRFIVVDSEDKREHLAEVLETLQWAIDGQHGAPRWLPG